MATEKQIETVARQMYEAKGDRKGICYAGWDNEPESIKDEWRHDIRQTIELAEAAAWCSDMSAAPRDGTLICYRDKFEGVGHCRWSVAIDGNDCDCWWDYYKDDEVCPVMWRSPLFPVQPAEEK